MCGDVGSVLRLVLLDFVLVTLDEPFGGCFVLGFDDGALRFVPDEMFDDELLVEPFQEVAGVFVLFGTVGASAFGGVVAGLDVRTLSIVGITEVREVGLFDQLLTLRIERNQIILRKVRS